MFTKGTVKAFSIVAIVLSSVGLLFSVLGTFLLQTDSSITISFFMGIISWSLLLWASIIGYQLCAKYKLYDEEYKKVGLRIYAIILAFVLFFFVGLVAGIFIAVIILSTLWSLKSNYDDWDGNDDFLQEVQTNDTTNAS